MFTVLVWTTGEMLTAPFAASYAAGRAPQGSAGRYMGVFSLVFSVAHMVGPVGGLLVYEHWGPHVVWYLAGLLSVGLFPILWILARLRDLRVT